MWVKFEFRDKTWYQKYHILHNFIRDPLLAACMVFFHDMPILQTLFASLIMLVSAVLDTIHWPYREKGKNILLILTGFMYFAINSLFMVLGLSEGKMRRETQYLYIGFMIIFIISCIIIVDIGFATVEVFGSIKKWWKERKNKKKKKKKNNNKIAQDPVKQNKSSILNSSEKKNSSSKNSNLKISEPGFRRLNSFRKKSKLAMMSQKKMKGGSFKKRLGLDEVSSHF